jgi:uncharacterized RDD family membrane protein YckC
VCNAPEIHIDRPISLNSPTETKYNPFVEKMNPIAGVVNHVIEVVDVDGVVRKIDVNDVVERIDVDKMVQRINIDNILSRINWNKQLERIDFDAVLRRVDTSSIVARSSTGMFTTFLDTLRTQVTMIDLYLRIVGRCRIWREQHRRRCYLPPAPGHHRQRDDRRLYPKGRSNKAVAVQGRYCGFVSKTISILMDVFSVTLLFALLFRLIEWFLILFLRQSHDEAENKTKDFQREGNMWMVVAYCCLWFAYFFLSVALAGQTFGMAVVGLKVCDCRRSSPYSTVSATQALIRTCLLPVTLTLFPPLGIIGFVRRDGRMLHDLVANTGMIYLWDAELAKVRHQALRGEQGSAVSDDDAFDELDELLGSEVVEVEGYQQDDDNGSFQDQEVTWRRNRRPNDRSSGESSSLLRNSYSMFPSENNTERDRPGGCHMV